jgi:hypothetical protein
LAKGEQVDVILLDFSKAFDKVPHHRLLHKRPVYYLEDGMNILSAGEGNVKIYSPKSTIFPEGNARGEYDTRG